MNRRGFLKSIGKVVAGCAVVPSAAKAGATEGKLATMNPEDFNGFATNTKPVDSFLLKRALQKRDEQDEFIRQDFIRPEVEYEKIIRALLEKENFPKECII